MHQVNTDPSITATYDSLTLYTYAKGHVKKVIRVLEVR